MNIPDTYKVLRHEQLKECNSNAWILSHRKSGARLFLLKNDDKNRVFTIGFRTPPADSTGTPHILEHSVLCGSKKFPVKDPFMELEKGSLQTFLNAMTYPDKTIYPVASCNEKDFRNLCDIYMDAVLHPAIYQEEKIFRQEGWHYEMEDEKSDLTVNGVVYNEMKGAFSSPEDVLERYIQGSLFPDTPYAFESGGDPDEIPNLSYDSFVAFHRRYYHPSNSYIYLYGDLDFEEQLNWLDREYLRDYDRQDISSALPLQPPFPAPVERSVSYPIPKGEDPAGKAYLSESWVIGEITDPRLYLAFQVLDSVLLSTTGAPLRQALDDSGIAEEIYGGYMSGTRQPYFSVIAKNADENRMEEFRDIIRRTLEYEAEHGIDRRALEGSLNLLEFKSREADFGAYPRGLIYGIECFDSWLYDSDPMVHLRWEDTFHFLREQMDTGYFENLIRRYLLENPHAAWITLLPEAGLMRKKDKERAEHWEKLRDAMSPEEIQNTVRQTRELKEYQSQPSTPEQLATLPQLAVSDISEEPEPLNYYQWEAAEVPVISHDIFTSGILYPRILFRADRIGSEEIPYLGLLRQLLSMLSTEHYSFRELTSEILLQTGGIGLSLPVYQNVKHPEKFSPYIEINVRTLKDRLPEGLSLMQEILLHTDYSDGKRIRTLIAEHRSRVLTNLQDGGHSTAVSRASSYASALSAYNEKIGGVDYLEFLGEMQKEAETEEGAIRIGEKLKELAGRLFVRSGMLVSLTCPKEDNAYFAECFRKFADAFPEGSGHASPDPDHRPCAAWPFEPNRRNEGLRTAAQIQYVAACGNSRRTGEPYTGALRVLQKILSDDYLWTNLRVKGGAYGCMCGFGRSGSGYFASYRDPHLRRTLETYRNIPAFIADFQCSERDMTNYIIGSIGRMDRPMNPAEAGAWSFQAWMNGVTDEMLRQERREVLHCSQADIRALAPRVQAILDCDQICAVGNAGKLDSEQELFGEVRTLK